MILYLTEHNGYYIIDNCKELNFTQGEKSLANNVQISILMDYYGDVLTKKQRSFLDYYYNDDLSLQEIAENEGITRQGVYDSIKRAEHELFETEEKLGFIKKSKELDKILDAIIRKSDEINDFNLSHDILSREINDMTVEIKSLALSLKGQ